MRRLIAGLAAAAALAAFPNASMAASDPIGDLISAVQTAGAEALQAPMWMMKATLYNIGARGVGSRDSMGCRVSAMRTLAVDPSIVPRGTIVFIKETVGLPMPQGGQHDGLWYASDTGGAIKGQRIDLFTGTGRASMAALMALNLHALSVTRVGQFHGCPPAT